MGLFEDSGEVYMVFHYKLFAKSIKTNTIPNFTHSRISEVFLSEVFQSQTW